jgi:hypothetical protein
MSTKRSLVKEALENEMASAEAQSEEVVREFA